MEKANKITVFTSINSTIDDVWKKWTTPADIVKWNHASDEWHTTKAENNVVVFGNFNFRMEAKDGSFGFDLKGDYTNVIPFILIESTLEDNRKVKVSFDTVDGKVYLIQSFEPESINSHELQRMGWQAILDNFKKYVESK
jgi:uncharacterized protein YndB with AHSA1/START domain